jgi:hypothetical protein
VAGHLSTEGLRDQSESKRSRHRLTERLALLWKALQQLLKLLQLRWHDLKQLLQIQKLLLLKRVHLLKLLRHDLQQLRDLLPRLQRGSLACVCAVR